MQASQFHVTMIDRSGQPSRSADATCSQLVVERDWDILQINFNRIAAQPVDWTEDAACDPASITTTIVGVYAATEVTSGVDIFKLVHQRPEDVLTAGRFLPAEGHARIWMQDGVLRLEACVRDSKGTGRDAASIINAGAPLFRAGRDQDWRFAAEQEPLMA